MLNQGQLRQEDRLLGSCSTGDATKNSSSQQVVDFLPCRHKQAILRSQVPVPGFPKTGSPVRAGRRRRDDPSEILSGAGHRLGRLWDHQTTVCLMFVSRCCQQQMTVYHLRGCGHGLPLPRELVQQLHLNQPSSSLMLVLQDCHAAHLAFHLVVGCCRVILVLEPAYWKWLGHPFHRCRH